MARNEMPGMLAAALSLLGLAVFPIANASSAATETCGQWIASVSSLAGEGVQLNARVCASGQGPVSSIEVTCLGGMLNFRFLPELPAASEDYTGKSQDLLFAVGSATRRVFSTYEALDGAFARTLETNHPLFESIKAGTALEISDPEKKFPTYRLSLAGARKALDRVISDCK